MNELHTMQLSMQTEAKSSDYSCKCCGKTYTRKISRDRHYLLCELLHCSKREKKCIEEETTNIPSHLELYKIVQELAYKNSVLEEKMEEMQKWLDKKKKKIDIIHWLTMNKTNIENPFSEWQKKMVVTSDHVQLLIEENIVKTICDIISENIIANQELPIVCFQQKTNLFYIHQEEGWKRASPQEIILFIQHIHKKLWMELSNWKIKNMESMKNNSKLEDLCARTTIKISSFNFEQDSTYMCRVRTHLYNQLKIDLKNILEYEFQF